MSAHAAASTVTPINPSRGRVGMLAFILFEGLFFATFVLAYLFYVGKSPSGPQPREVLGLRPVIFNSICLLSSSGTIALAGRALRRGRLAGFSFWLGLTVLLGIEFLAGTGFEWKRLIFDDGLTIQTSLFGTTYFSLVGFHAAHVTAGLVMLSIILVASLAGHVRQGDAERVEVVSMYWHFVDGVWVAVFTAVYVVGR